MKRKSLYKVATNYAATNYSTSFQADTARRTDQKLQSMLGYTRKAKGRMRSWEFGATAGRGWVLWRQLRLGGGSLPSGPALQARRTDRHRETNGLGWAGPGRAGSKLAKTEKGSGVDSLCKSTIGTIYNCHFFISKKYN